MTIKNQKGFTLVELLVVIAIIAILGVVAIASINPVAKINSAKDNQALANVQQISKALEACLADRIATAGVTAAVATDNCCGTAVANAACVSTAALVLVCMVTGLLKVGQLALLLTGARLLVRLSALLSNEDRTQTTLSTWLVVVRLIRLRLPTVSTVFKIDLGCA